MIEVMDDAARLLGAQRGRRDRGPQQHRDDGVLRRPRSHARSCGCSVGITPSDLGYKDEDGYVYLVDRKKDMIITGGFNVYPSEVERVILTRSEVLDCAVIGVPDEKWGEALKAIVQLKPGAAIDAMALLGRRQGTARQREDAEVGRGLAGPAEERGRQGAEARDPHQVLGRPRSGRSNGGTAMIATWI